MPKLNEAAKCSSDKETAAAASSATLPQTAEHSRTHTHSHAHSRMSSTALKENVQHGLSTKVALSRLHEEIEKVLLQHEREHDAER